MHTTGPASQGTDSAPQEIQAKTNAAVPDWLAEAAGPAVVGSATAGGPNVTQGYDDGCNGLEYGYDGYPYNSFGYSGYGYHDYGFDGYGYDGYYGPCNCREGFVNNETNTNPTNNRCSSGTGAAEAKLGGEGGGLSWLSNAASTVQTLTEREENDASSTTNAQPSRAGNVSGATELPPMSGTAGAASMPWMAAR